MTSDSLRHRLTVNFRLGQEGKRVKTVTNEVLDDPNTGTSGIGTVITVIRTRIKPKNRR